MASVGSMNQRKSGVWTLRVEIPPRDGARRWKAKTFRGTKRAAQVALREFAEETHKKYELPTARDLTTTQLFELWLDGLSLTTTDPRAATTIHRNKSAYFRHIAPRFGERLVESLTRDEVRAFEDGLRRPHTVRGEKRRALSAKSVANLHSLLCAMCRWGVEYKLIPFDPLYGARRPRFVLGPPRVPEHHEVDAVLQRLWREDVLMWLAVRLAATIGVRRSELVALRWSNIKWAKGKKPARIVIEKGITYVPGLGLVETKTKTGPKGSGEIAIDEELEEVLKEQWMNFYARTGDPRGYMFSSDPMGEIPIHPDTLTTRLKRATEGRSRSPGRTQVTFKSLRAYVASELEALGFSEATAQAVLRHQSPLTTQRHYAAARDRKMREATVAVGRGFSSRGRNGPTLTD